MLNDDTVSLIFDVEMDANSRVRTGHETRFNKAGTESGESGYMVPIVLQIRIWELNWKYGPSQC